jgi:predicted xylose isomerase-like sugar epimerase
MEKVLILCIVIALGFGASGATCLQNTMCSPPADVMAVAKAAAPVIQMAIIMLVPGTAAYLAAVDAAAAVDYIQDGICLSITQLNALIAFLQSSDAKVANAKMMMKAGPARAKALNIQPLIDWKDAVK